MTLHSGSAAPSAEAIQTWIIEQMAFYLNLDAADIDPREPFARYGLDSVQAVTLAGELEDWLAVRLPATLVWDYPTVASLSRHLAETTRPS